jgi:hypothetical protein
MAGLTYRAPLNPGADDQKDQMIAEYSGTVPKGGDRVRLAEQLGLFELETVIRGLPTF